MGTRGAYGLRKNETDKLMYNHYDSYPTFLGVNILKHIKSQTDEQLSAQFDFLQDVDAKIPPTEDQIKQCESTTNLNVSNQSTKDWYCLLRDAQGELSKQLPPNGIPYFINSNNFVKDSLFCEWGYIINIDTGKLEVYHGFNPKKGGKGRYAEFEDKYSNEKSDSKYYGIVLIAEITFAEIREWDEKKIEKIAKKLEGMG